MRTLACIQPSYIPWRGYFHQIRKSQVFVFYDNVQYTKQDWRNRNRIKTPYGTKWITVPVTGVKLGTKIDEVRIASDSDWAGAHWRQIEDAYRDAPHFTTSADRLRPIYAVRWALLSELDIRLTIEICSMLGIEGVEFRRTSELGLEGEKTERLVHMCRMLGADRYLTGPAARSYLDVGAFRKAGIEVEWMMYDYPEYEQLHPPYDPRVTILDLLFMKGPGAGRFIWGEAPAKRACR